MTIYGTFWVKLYSFLGMTTHESFEFFLSVHNFVCFAYDKKIANIQHRLIHRSKLRTLFKDKQSYFIPFHLLNLEVS